MECKRIRLALIGNTGSGKTSIVLAFTHDKPPGENPPSIQDTAFSKKIKQTDVYVELWDTPGNCQSPQVNKLRLMSYGNTDLFLICFPVTSPTSFESIATQWIPEIRRHGDIPFMLVGTKTDLRETEKCEDSTKNKSNKRFMCDEGQAAADSSKALMYKECSIFNNHTVQELINDAATAAYEHKFGKRS